jgi:hypothetical protein
MLNKLGHPLVNALGYQLLQTLHHRLLLVLQISLLNSALAEEVFVFNLLLRRIISIITRHLHGLDSLMLLLTG